MFRIHLIVVVFTVCAGPSFSGIVDSKPHTHHQVQHRTWDQAIAMAKEFIQNLTLEEKCNMTVGVNGSCAGEVLPIPRLNFNGMCYQDSPSGVGDKVLHSTAFAAGIHIAATWDRDLFYQRGAAIGKEFHDKGVHFVLGPMINIDRNARHGRNWEGFGSDPYLSGENAFAYVQGVQDQGVVATAKHYICNEQETNRRKYSANLDDKTIHEVYLWPFASSVVAGAGSVMCSYNLVNGTAACQNNKTLNGLLKGELEFRGNVMSDWGATKKGLESALGGLDIQMPRFNGLMGYALLPFVENGSLPETRLNDMIIRNMAPYYLLGQDQGFPSLDLDRDVTGNNYLINRQVASAGMILLKNTNNVLPFKVGTDTYIYIYGAAAGQSNEGLHSGGSTHHAGALYQGGGSGFVNPTYGLDPLTTLMIKGRDAHLQVRYITNQSDYAAINNSFQDRGFNNAKCLVFISAYSSESSDRRDLYALSKGDKLVQTVASHCENTIVLVNSVSQLNLEAWADHPNVKGILWTGIPGCEYGPALVDVLFGDYNPGGKLVFTLAKNESDYGTNISMTLQSNYTEGVFLDYRHFDKYNITPRYYFGYGLSYTNFSFAKLEISKASTDKGSASSQYRQRRTKPYASFGSSSLHEPVYEIKFTITNTGNVNGSEVSQLYVGFPAVAEEPKKVLRGFERVYLTAGESKQVSMVLTEKDISYWNVVNQKWTVALGEYTVWISTSANDADVKFQSSFHM